MFHDEYMASRSSYLSYLDKIRVQRAEIVKAQEQGQAEAQADAQARLQDLLDKPHFLILHLRSTIKVTNAAEEIRRLLEAMEARFMHHYIE